MAIPRRQRSGVRRSGRGAWLCPPCPFGDGGGRYPKLARGRKVSRDRGSGSAASGGDVHSDDTEYHPAIGARGNVVWLQPTLIARANTQPGRGCARLEAAAVYENDQVRDQRKNGECQKRDGLPSFTCLILRTCQLATEPP